MAMTILEMLSSEEPNGTNVKVKNATLKPIFRLTQKHMSEIEKARARGYSWKQIDEACRETWRNDPEAKKIVWWKKAALIEHCYLCLKKGKMPEHATPFARKQTTGKQYRIAVTEE